MKELSYEFTDATLLQQALTHRSCPGANNERLEFLGDAVLDFVVSEIVYRSHANASEGDLSKLRASLVKDTSLGELAKGLGMGEHLILGGGERKSGGHRRESILADALEALFGAVYLDSGIAAATSVIERVFSDRLQNLPSLDELRDPKTRLQEWLQGRGHNLPSYQLLQVSGKTHKQKFEVSCSIQDAAEITTGSGTTRRNAEQAAALAMLVKLGEEEADNA
ncbi:MAG: ribonuclease III [Woeseiaceae bacterium]